MAVGIVPDDSAVVQPQYAGQAESALQFLPDFFPVQIFVSVDRTQARGCGEHRAASVRVDAPSLKDIGTHVDPHHVIIECPAAEYGPGQLIVKVRGEFQPPSVEHKVIDIFFAVIPVYGDAAVVPRPGVIERSLIKQYPVRVKRHSCPRADLGDVILRLIDVPCHYHQRLKVKYIAGYVDITFKHPVYLIPFGIPVRPCQLHPALPFPFCRKSHLYKFL